MHRLRHLLVTWGEDTGPLDFFCLPLFLFSHSASAGQTFHFFLPVHSVMPSNTVFFRADSSGPVPHTHRIGELQTSSQEAQGHSGTWAAQDQTQQAERCTNIVPITKQKETGLVLCFHLRPVGERIILFYLLLLVLQIAPVPLLRIIFPIPFESASSSPPRHRQSQGLQLLLLYLLHALLSGNKNKNATTCDFMEGPRNILSA